jgi:alpha-beta hydrolase superfamily lysophospholipase
MVHSLASGLTSTSPWSATTTSEIERAYGVHGWITTGVDWCAAAWHPAARDGADDRARSVAVMCPSLGLEHLRGRRGFRQLAARLSARGVASLRFDLPDIGNSTTAAGRNTQGAIDLVDRWHRALDHAIELARTLVPDAPLIVIGRRFGALLAAGASRAPDRVDQLVLWDPCISGSSYVRELRLLEASRVRGEMLDAASAFAGTELVESLGFAYAPEVIAAMESHALASGMPSSSTKTLCVSQLGAAKISKILDGWIREGRQVQHTSVADAQFDPEDWRAPNLPVATFDAILSGIEIDVGHQPLARAESNAAGDAVAGFRTEIDFSISEGEREGHNTTVLRERVVRLPESGRLVAYVTERTQAPPREVGVIVLRSLGGNGAHVRIARRWAALGATVARIDLSGNDESRTREGEPENNPYPTHGVDDLREMVAWMRAQLNPNAEVVVFGFCAEAYYAVTAVEEGVAIDRVIAVNPPLYWEGSFDVDFSEIADVVAEYRAGKPIPWTRRARRIFADDEWRPRLARAVKLRIARWTRRDAQKSDATGPRRLKRLDLRRTFPPSTRWHVIFSDGDPGLLHLLSHRKADRDRLNEQPGFELTVCQTSDHLFLSQNDRAWLNDFMTSRLPLAAR